MRLWHQDLISRLPDKQLLGQHRECCALRGKGWGRKHSVVDYVFKHERSRLYCYHLLVMKEMVARGFNVDAVWYNRLYRGKNLPASSLCEEGTYVVRSGEQVYPEHDDAYYAECMENLQRKHAKLMPLSKI